MGSRREETLPVSETDGQPFKEDDSTTKTNSSSPKVSARQYLQTEIHLDHADIPIILCCLVSGLCDSSAYNAWTCFVSMQTGTIYFSMLQYFHCVYISIV